MAGFIRYDVRNGVEYASVYRAKRVDGKKTNDIEWLGRVVDKEKGLYQSKRRGLFQYILNSNTVDYLPTSSEKLILDFGDSFFLNEMLVRSGFFDLNKRFFGGNTDTLLSLVFYRSLQGGANCYAQTWWEGSYARLLFPKASLASQRISEFMREIGDEQVQRDFFKDYLRFIAPQCSGGILIDSTGLPNDMNTPFTAISNHNGVISNESRLIFVLDKKSSMPIYFRYVAGNIVDVTTIQATIAEMRAYGIDIHNAIIDAGYYSEKNIKALRKSEISFLLRMPSNRKLYKEHITKHAASLEDAKYLVKYRDRFVYIKIVETDLFGKTAYFYIGLDIDRKHDEIKNYMGRAFDDKTISFDDMNAAMQSKGIFILVSSDKVETKDILPLYYTRQAIEQVFDIGKNNADLLPLRVHNIDNFRGHLLLSFIVAVGYVLVNKMLKGSEVCAIGAYRVFRNLKCKVYDDRIIVQEANRKMNDIARHVKLSIPVRLDV